MKSCVPSAPLIVSPVVGEAMMVLRAWNAPSDIINQAATPNHAHALVEDTADTAFPPLAGDRGDLECCS